MERPVVRTETSTKCWGLVTASSVALLLVTVALLSALCCILSVTAMASDNWYVLDGSALASYNVMLSPNWLCRGSSCQSFPNDNSVSLCRDASEIVARLRGISASLVIGFIFFFISFCLFVQLSADFQWAEEYLRSTEAGLTKDRLDEAGSICKRGPLFIRVACGGLVVGFVLTCIGVGIFRTSVDSYFNCGHSFCLVLAGTSDFCSMGHGYGVGVACCVISGMTAVLALAGLRGTVLRLEQFEQACSLRLKEVRHNVEEIAQVHARELDLMHEAALRNGQRQTAPPTTSSAPSQQSQQTFRPRSAAEPYANPITPAAQGGPLPLAAKKDLRYRAPPMLSSDDVWTFDEPTELFFSASRKMFYDPQSEQYYDPVTEKWFDPEKQVWYSLS